MSLLLILKLSVTFRVCFDLMLRKENTIGFVMSYSKHTLHGVDTTVIEKKTKKVLDKDDIVDSTLEYVVIYDEKLYRKRCRDRMNRRNKKAYKTAMAALE